MPYIFLAETSKSYYNYLHFLSLDFATELQQIKI